MLVFRARLKSTKIQCLPRPKEGSRWKKNNKMAVARYKPQAYDEHDKRPIQTQVIPVLRQTLAAGKLVSGAGVTLVSGGEVTRITDTQSTRWRLALSVDHTLTACRAELTNRDPGLAHSIICNDKW